MILYNTIMAIAAAGGLILVVLLATAVRASRGQLDLAPWAWAFGSLGIILLITGAHMTLTWPLDQSFPDFISPNCCRPDNIIFGEPSLYLGAVFIGLNATLLTAERRRGLLPYADTTASQQLERPLPDDARSRPTPTAPSDVIREAVTPLAYVAGFGGLMLFMIGLAGAWHGMFIAPPSEPISSLFRFWHIETVYVVLSYWLIGIGAVLTPFALRRRGLSWYWGASLTLGALMIGWLGLMSFFGHIALAGQG